MKKLILLITLLFSTMVFSQTELKIESYQFALSTQSLDDVPEYKADGKIKIYDDYIHFQFNNEVDDILVITSEPVLKTIDGVRTLTFSAMPQKGGERILVRFAGDNYFMVVFSDLSVLVVKFE